MNTYPIFYKDPAATLDYTYDWTKWLEAGDTISSHAVTVPAGVSKVSDSHTTTAVTVWVSGGTVGTYYDIVFQVSTVGGRIDERTVKVLVADR